MPPPTRGKACQSASCPLDACATASGAAREFTRHILGSWGLLTLAEDAAVIVSELVTNAVRHGVRDASGPAGDRSAHQRVELILLRRPGHMICLVTDPGEKPPVPATARPSDVAGRGLQVIKALAATWGWMPLGACQKAVWAALTVPGAGRSNGH
jgi:anti-sigma regulatory factor (Ser/Thr protein kinase)